MIIKDMRAAIEILEKHRADIRAMTVAEWLREEIDRRQAHALIAKQAKALKISTSEARARMKKAGLFPGYPH